MLLLSPASAPAEKTGGAPVTMTTRVLGSSRSSAEGGAQLGQHRVAQRVAPVGAVQGDGGDEAVAREEDVFTHGGSIIIGAGL